MGKDLCLLGKICFKSLIYILYLEHYIPLIRSAVPQFVNFQWLKKTCVFNLEKWLIYFVFMIVTVVAQKINK